MHVKKPRVMSPEHKAKLAAAQMAKREQLTETRVNSNDKLKKFVTEFLYPLIGSYNRFVKSAEIVGGGETIKFRRYQKLNKKGVPVGPVSCSIGVSVLWLEKKHGRTAAAIFKKLFKRTARGGWSTKERASYSSTWVPNDKVYNEAFEQADDKFTREGELAVYELIKIIEKTVEYQYVPTWYFAETQKSGMMKLIGDPASKRMVGPKIRAKLAVTRAEKKAYVARMNALIKQEAVIDRYVNLEAELHRRSIRAEMAQLLELANKREEA